MITPWFDSIMNVAFNIQLKLWQKLYQKLAKSLISFAPRILGITIQQIVQKMNIEMPSESLTLIKVNYYYCLFPLSTYVPMKSSSMYEKMLCYCLLQISFINFAYKIKCFDLKLYVPFLLP